MSSKIEKDSLGGRMKEYEFITRNSLIRNLPVIVRLDGRAFHTFTKGFRKPMDSIISTCMINTMQELCNSTQGCKLGYTQSDEISLFLCDYDSIKSSSFLKNNIQKITSILASKATNSFNSTLITMMASMDESDKRKDLIRKKIFKAEFDCRAFNLPRNEVINYFIWRQQDAVRNSIQGLGQSVYSQKELHEVNMKDLQNKLFTEKGINWNSLPIYQKRGLTCIKGYESHEWFIDYCSPIFSQDRGYIEDLVIGSSEFIENFLNTVKIGDEVTSKVYSRIEGLYPKVCSIRFIHKSQFDNMEFKKKLENSGDTIFSFVYKEGRKIIVDRLN